MLVTQKVFAQSFYWTFKVFGKNNVKNFKILLNKMFFFYFSIEIKKLKGLQISKKMFLRIYKTDHKLLDLPSLIHPAHRI